MEKKERILWIDALKGFTIIFVIIGHVLLGYTNNNTFPEFQEIMVKINYWIYSWHMPLFMVISGFAFKIAYFKDKKLDKKRINKQNKSVEGSFPRSCYYFRKICFNNKEKQGPLVSE